MPHIDSTHWDDDVPAPGADRNSNVEVQRKESMNTTELVHVPRGGEVTKADFTPLFTVEDAIERKKQIGQIIAGVLVDGSDYGKIPGGRDTKILMKPGAEKLASMFGLTPRYIAEQEIEDWTGEDHGGEPLFYYKYRCQLFRGERLLGEAIGSCSTWESKYRYRWMTAEEADARNLNPNDFPSRGGVQTLTEPQFAIERGETGGKYGKPLEYWDAFRQAIQNDTAVPGHKAKKDGGMMPTWSIQRDTTLYRIPNPDVADSVNTCQKMAQKRAFVAVVLVATNASDSFTQDLEDFDTSDIDTGGHPAGTQAAQDHVRDTKLAKSQTVPANDSAGNGSGASSVPPSAGPSAPGPSPAPELRVPEELTVLFQNLSSPAGQRQALAMLKRELNEALPNSGAMEYERLFRKYGLSKPHLLNELTKCLLEMWNIAQWAKQHGAGTAKPGEPPNDHEQLFDDGPPQKVMYGD